MIDSVAILGAGAWGTALAVHLSRGRASPRVRLWARDATQASALAARHENARYLPGVTVPSSIRVTAKIDEAVSGAGLVVVATPIAALLQLVAALQPVATAPVVWL